MPIGDRTSDYDFELPRDLIAQHPLPERDASRLMVLDRAAGTIAHRQFRDIAELIAPELVGVSLDDACAVANRLALVERDVTGEVD